jgi:hypothetical protein
MGLYRAMMGLALRHPGVLPPCWRSPGRRDGRAGGATPLPPPPPRGYLAWRSETAWGEAGPPARTMPWCATCTGPGPCAAAAAAPEMTPEDPGNPPHFGALTTAHRSTHGSLFCFSSSPLGIALYVPESRAPDPRGGAPAGQPGLPLDVAPADEPDRRRPGESWSTRAPGSRWPGASSTTGSTGATAAALAGGRLGHPLPAPRPGDRFEVISAGPDREFGTDDDLVRGSMVPTASADGPRMSELVFPSPELLLLAGAGLLALMAWLETSLPVGLMVPAGVALALGAFLAHDGLLPLPP